MTFIDYFQIAIVVIILGVITTKVIYLKAVTGVNPIVIGQGKGAWRIVEILSLGSVVLWLTEVVLHALHIYPRSWDFLLLNIPAVKVLGLVLVSFGLVVFLLAFFSFGKSWRIGIDRDTPGTLVTEGIFGITRNPIYVAFHLYFIGIFLIHGTLFFLVFALMAAVAVHFQIRREEEFLKRQYGGSFQAYCARTPRYLLW